MLLSLMATARSNEEEGRRCCAVEDCSGVGNWLSGASRHEKYASSSDGLPATTLQKAESRYLARSSLSTYFYRLHADLYIYIHVCPERVGAKPQENESLWSKDSIGKTPQILCHVAVPMGTKPRATKHRRGRYDCYLLWTFSF